MRHFCLTLLLLGGEVAAQSTTSPRDIRQQSSASTPAATKLEAFKPTSGSLVTLGYEDLGDINFGRVRMDVREMRDSKGGLVRGVLVRVSDTQFHQEEAYVDPDEIPELLKGIDAILRTKSNPTSFKAFELRYVTRGELEVSAYNTDAYVQYAITAGRVTKATAVNLNSADIAKFRAMLVAANDRLVAAAAGR
jgi:hypothetical protein